jgi:hypothetical protein
VESDFYGDVMDTENGTVLGSTNKPYQVNVAAALDGNGNPYFLYSDVTGKPLVSPIVFPSAEGYDSVRYQDIGTGPLRLWGQNTHTVSGSGGPQGDNQSLAPGGQVTIPVRKGTTRSTILIFTNNSGPSGAFVGLVPTPDPVAENPPG